jgi:uncharacterized protein (UPF0548 family)
VLTYPEVGATAGELPAGYHHLRRSRNLGPADLDELAERLFAWEVQRLSGLTVDGPRVAQGVDVVVGFGLGPVRIPAPCRVVYVVTEPDRRGFAYGTLPGHPESGEEAFLLSRNGNDITFEIVAFSRPARWFSRLGAPVARRVQSRITDRYLAAL